MTSYTHQFYTVHMESVLSYTSIPYFVISGESLYTALWRQRARLADTSLMNPADRAAPRNHRFLPPELENAATVSLFDGELMFGDGHDEGRSRCITCTAKSGRKLATRPSGDAWEDHTKCKQLRVNWTESLDGYLNSFCLCSYYQGP